jgi:hypothetical protein
VDLQELTQEQAKAKRMEAAEAKALGQGQSPQANLVDV